ncbi:MAG: NADH-quinone oxidoreductase subunit C [Tepidisphaeraceae bacterium]
MSQESIELITVELLLDKVKAMRQQGYRLVQISGARLGEQLELTYSFDRDSRLENLRLHLPAADPRVPSISSIYSCVMLYENELHDLFDIQVEGMAVDFHGHLYNTAIKHPFGGACAPGAAPAPPGAGTGAGTGAAPTATK